MRRFARRGLIETAVVSILALFGSGAAFIGAMTELQGCVEALPLPQ